jgi:hypothetical protein
MQLASGLVTGIGAILFGAALLWFGMPNKAGESPRFLRNGLVEMVYPAIVLGSWSSALPNFCRRGESSIQICGSDEKAPAEVRPGLSCLLADKGTECPVPLRL